MIQSGSINIDKTAPVVTFSTSPAAPDGKNGWYRSNVSVSWKCSDGLSGIDSATPCPGSTAITTDGTQTLSTGTIRDGAGNLASAVSLTIQRDATPPTLTAHRSPDPNASGWNNSSVTISFECNDSASGVASCGAGPQTLSSEGANQTMSSGSVEDLAGNVASSLSVTGINC
ncbi:hypothetical protein HYR53_00335 [Candidatus Acetothermia bacterium]|nr:hypothetical protein [Candidatus Acetothermia bacterium]